MKNIFTKATILLCMIGLLIIGFIVGFRYKGDSSGTSSNGSETINNNYIKTFDVSDKTNLSNLQTYDFNYICETDLVGKDTLNNESETPTSIRFICEEGTFIIYKSFCVVDTDGWIVSEYNPVAQYISNDGDKTTIYKDSFSDIVIVPERVPYTAKDGRTLSSTNGWKIIYNGCTHTLNKIQLIDYRYWNVGQ